MSWLDLFNWGYATDIEELEEDVNINITIEFEEEQEKTVDK